MKMFNEIRRTFVHYTRARYLTSAALALSLAALALASPGPALA